MPTAAAGVAANARAGLCLRRHQSQSSKQSKHDRSSQTHDESREVMNKEEAGPAHFAAPGWGGLRAIVISKSGSSTSPMILSVPRTTR